jgi:hypothetical protein
MTNVFVSDAQFATNDAMIAQAPRYASARALEHPDTLKG